MTLPIFLEMKVSSAWPWGTLPEELGRKASSEGSAEFGPWVRKIPWRRKWQPIPVFLSRKSHGQRSLVG